MTDTTITDQAKELYERNRQSIIQVMKRVAQARRALLPIDTKAKQQRHESLMGVHRTLIEKLQELDNLQIRTLDTDPAIAQLVKDLNKATKDAKEEAKRIDRIQARIDTFTGFINQMTGVIDMVLKLT